MSEARVSLQSFDNSWYRPGRSRLSVHIWFIVNRIMFLTWIPWPSTFKSWVLRKFGARVGRGVVWKNRVSIKYPWNLTIGDHTWIGEGVWIDSLAPVTLGSDVCLSQGCMIETGNHDWSKVGFDLRVAEVVVEDGAWAAVRSLILPGSNLRSHAVLAGGSTLSGDTEPYGIYVGTPARFLKRRRIAR